MNRRQFIGRTGSTLLFCLANPSAFAKSRSRTEDEFVFLEAEQFANLGGWDLDQQSMDQMGSPYLLAHGLGIPVKDAVTTVTFPSSGKYRVWVRTRDWVAPWKAPGTPGKFQLLVDGMPLKETFGTKGADWHWHDGGIVKVGGKATVTLHDLTGFEGRCEAILFCKDTSFEPTNELAALTKFRRALLGLPEHPEDGGTFDLIVVGGGLAGTCAALSAARNGLHVALVQDRPVLGGNCSSEIRVWAEGHTRQQPYPHLGEIVDEICPQNPPPGNKNAKAADLYDDPRKTSVVLAENRITLLAGQRAVAVETEDHRIRAVIVQHTRTARQIRLRAALFADCTGDATIGFLAGADYEMSRTGKMGTSNLWNVLNAADAQQVLHCECKDKDALSMGLTAHEVEQPFPRCPWALDLTDKPFPGRKNFKGQWAGAKTADNLGNWFWESGFDQDPATEIERIRDFNFRAMYGAWDALKNVDQAYPNHRLGWAAFIAGKRESRRLLGDVIVTADDFRTLKQFPDAAFPCSWHIDLHSPDPRFSKGLGNEAFIARSSEGKEYSYQGPYWAPYRCLYSRNIGNLFMAGRDISVSSDGLGPVRVMRTCGIMGEIVGKAAAICVARKTAPRGVFQEHLPELHEMMKQPGKTRV